jgi:hypothetical protein
MIVAAMGSYVEGLIVGALSVVGGLLFGWWVARRWRN